MCGEGGVKILFTREDWDRRKTPGSVGIFEPETRRGFQVPTTDSTGSWGCPCGGKETSTAKVAGLHGKEGEERNKIDFGEVGVTSGIYGGGGPPGRGGW